MAELYALPVQVQSVHRTRNRFSLYLPRVTGMKNTEAQETMNRAIGQTAESMLRQLGYYENPEHTEVTGFYEIKTNERGVLSIALNIYAYTYPAAHGLTLIEALTFDVSTGRSYTLGQLFKPGSDYVKTISEIVSAQIKERDVPTLEPFTVIRPDQDFYVADKAVVVYFQLYELTPYVYGFPMFPISVYDLQDLVAEDGPLQPMLANQ